MGCIDISATAAWPVPPVGIALDLQRADGARLHIETHACQLPLVTLVRTFLETR